MNLTPQNVRPILCALSADLLLITFSSVINCPRRRVQESKDEFATD